MRRIFLIVVAAALFAAEGSAGQYGSRLMAGWSNVRTRDGWVGRRYMDGTETIAEEFDSNRDDRIDVWRFYHRGVLSSEERDLNHDGTVDFVTHWESRSGRLLSVMRDTHQRGVYDVEVEYKGRNRWEIHEDRNFDGISDRIIFVQAPQDIFDTLNVDLATQVDIASTIPLEYWTEMWSDDGFTGSITDYFRYSRGELTHHGDWDGKRIIWAKVPPDYVPPRPTPATPPSKYGQDQLARRYPDFYAPPPPGPAPIRDPFQLESDGIDPYAGIGPRSLESSPAWGGSQAALTPAEEEARVAREAQNQLARARAQAAAEGRTFGTLPRNESSAQAVPARMKAPGQTTTAVETPGRVRNSRRSRR